MTSNDTWSPCSRASDVLGKQDDNKLSPCISMCRLESIDSKQMTILQNNNLLDKDCINVELCISCGRTRDEIVNWREYDINQKEIIFKLSNQRLLEKLGKI